MAEALNDRESFIALLAGKKLERVRQAGSGRYVRLDNGILVDEEGDPAILYKMDRFDLYQEYEEPEDE